MPSVKLIGFLMESIKLRKNLTVQIHQAPQALLFYRFHRDTKSPWSLGTGVRVSLIHNSALCWKAAPWPQIKILTIDISIIGDGFCAHGIKEELFLSAAGSDLITRSLICRNRWLDREKWRGRGGGVGDGGGDNQSGLWSGAAFQISQTADEPLGKAPAPQEN